MKYRGYTLDPFQQEAIDALAHGRSVLVSAPTGTGKTLIADFVVERALALGRSVIYTAPVKALSNQKFRDWCRLHGEQNVGLITGDLVIRRDAPCRVMTTEILRNMLLVGEELPTLETVILDEIHFLDDRERGTTWEETLIYLPTSVQILGLSATLDNLPAFSEWMGSVREQAITVVTHHHRTIPLTWHVFSRKEGLLAPKEFHKAWGKRKAVKVKRGHEEGGRREGRGHERGHDRGHDRERRPSEPPTSHRDLVASLEPDLLPCLYFCFSRKNTERFARELAFHRDSSLLNDWEIRAVSQRLDQFEAASPKVLDPDMRDVYLTGVAFHHAGLHVQLKELVEDLYERKLIKVLYCTSTFALGINMPARTVCFDALAKYDGIRTRPLTNREFQQKAGRAGRRGLDTEGHVVVRVDGDEWPDLKDQLEGYLQGKAEPVRSSFSLSFHSVVNLIDRHSAEHIRQMVERSFLCWTRVKQAERMDAEAGERNTAKMRAKAAAIRMKTWEEFEERIAFLTRIGYMAEDRSFNAGARILQKVQIEEILTTELVLSGLLEDLPPDLLFGICCALNKDFPRDVRIRYKMSPLENRMAQQISRLRAGPVIRESEALLRQEVTWCPDMIPFGRMWAEGKSLAELSTFLVSTTDLSGDLVGAFRRAKDLIAQLRDVWEYDPIKVDAMNTLMHKISRDEVLVIG